MNIYLWEYVRPVYWDHHVWGAVLIVAPTLEAAREQWAADCDTRSIDSGALGGEPDRVWPTDPNESDLIYVFDYGGCC